MSEGTVSSEAPARPTPRVSVGLPVFNGENYLATAISAILAQTYTDFELIICDNASTDGTADICRDFARRDSRIRYYRNEANLGFGPNFDLCFERATGEYFKWVAHDDLIAPTYLEKTVAAMDANPDAILCSTAVQEIDDTGRFGRTYQNKLPGIDSTRAHERLAGMTLYRHQCEDIFGLLRRRPLLGSQLIGRYLGSDRVFLSEIALRGRCIMLNEPLFLHREHQQRYTRAILLGDRKRADVWQDTREQRRRRKPGLYHWLVYTHLWSMVNRNIASSGARLGCYRVLLQWWFTDYHFVDFLKDIIIAINPVLLVPARTIKRAIFGPEAERPGSLTPQG